MQIRQLNKANLPVLLLLAGLWIITAPAQNRASGPENNTPFSTICLYLDKDHYFQAQKLYEQHKSMLSSTERLLTEAILDNAFNKPAVSNKKIGKLLKMAQRPVPEGLVNATQNPATEKLIKTVYNSSPEKEHKRTTTPSSGKIIPDSVLVQLYQLRADNAIKLCDYRGAKEALEVILNSFPHLLDENQLAETNNSLTLWKALEKVPKQEIVIRENSRIRIEKDKIGLSNLKINNGADTIAFVFDTGANLSTVALSTARKLKMTIIPAAIQVGTITGDKVNASLAYCPGLQLGQIQIHNAVFLVMEDSCLSFPQVDYQIHGILGFPVMEALGEIQITKDDWFIVPQRQSRFKGRSNLAMNGLTPLICIEGKHFSFDTGADNTILYQAYYLDNKAKIEAAYSPVPVSFGGAGGKKDFDAYVITDTFNISGRSIVLKDIHLLRERIKDNENVYGNIGQDLIGQFEKMTINFSRMFVRFD